MATGLFEFCIPPLSNAYCCLCTLPKTSWQFRHRIAAFYLLGLTCFFYLSNTMSNSFFVFSSSEFYLVFHILNVKRVGIIV